MEDRVYDIKDDLIRTLMFSEESDTVKYYIDDEEVNLKFYCSRNDNGYIEIYFYNKEE